MQILSIFLLELSFEDFDVSKFPYFPIDPLSLSNDHHPRRDTSVLGSEMLLLPA